MFSPDRVAMVGSTHRGGPLKRFTKKLNWSQNLLISPRLKHQPCVLNQISVSVLLAAPPTKTMSLWNAPQKIAPTQCHPTPYPKPTNTTPVGQGLDNEERFELHVRVVPVDAVDQILRHLRDRRWLGVGDILHLKRSSEAGDRSSVALEAGSWKLVLLCSVGDSVFEVCWFDGWIRSLMNVHFLALN